MTHRPNILLLFTDQQRFDTIAALGNPYIQTPTLDRLVAEGTSFTSAYTPSPVCIAARCSLILGQYAHQTGCTANLPMPQERTSLMELLAAEGYQTHSTGKMHFWPDSHKMWGFESRDYSEEGGMREGDDFCDHLRHHGLDHIQDPNGVRSEWYYLPQPSQLPARVHHSTWVADRSIEFLGRRDRARPFFLWSSFIKPHPPFESPVPWNRLYKPVEMPYPHVPRGHEQLLTYWNRLQNRYKYRDEGFDGNLVRLIRAAYYAAISFVDYNAGRILAALERSGDLEHTLVMFASDHGELLGDYDSYGKRSLLDPAARVPLLVRWPARFTPGRRCDQVVSTVDVMPTLLQAADIPVPGEAAGVDLAQVAEGHVERDEVFTQYQEGGWALHGITTGQYKYGYSAPDNREYLFRREPGRLDERNLAGNAAYAKVLVDLRQRLIARLRHDGYETPLDGEGWKVWEEKTLPPEIDACRLFQEGQVDHLFPEGYEPRCKPAGGLPVQGI